MPDPMLMTLALATAAILAGVVVFMGSRPWPTPHPAGVRVGWVLGQVAGILAGCWLLGIRPHWPPKEDLDRLLVVVIPAITVAELTATWAKAPRWLVGALRLIVVTSVARVLLHGSSYVAGDTAWPLAQMGLIFTGMALALGTVWWLARGFVRRAPGLSVAGCLAVACAGAAVVVMLSGYATGGQVGIPLAGALAGAGTATLFLGRAARTTGPVGVPVVGLFSLLVVGLFFGELTLAHAMVLFFSPVLGWLLEGPYVNRLRPSARGLTRAFLVALVVGAVVLSAQRKFIEQSQSAPNTSRSEPTLQDYLDYGR